MQNALQYTDFPIPVGKPFHLLLSSGSVDSYFITGRKTTPYKLIEKLCKFKLIVLQHTQYTTVGLAYMVRCIVNSLVSHDLNVMKYAIQYFIRQTFSLFMIQPKICVNPGYKSSMLHTLAAGALLQRHKPLNSEFYVGKDFTVYSHTKLKI